MEKRNLTFDIMKGMTILLVIIGHELYLPSGLKHFIFAFHMPLFFLISGYFYHRGPISKDVKRLIIPYLFTGFLLLFYDIFYNLPSFDVNLLKRDVLKILWGSGANHSAPIAGDKPFIGAIWFLLALFWCKTVFGVIERRTLKTWLLGLLCAAISILSILLDRYCIYMPLSFFPGLAALVFYFLGYCMKGVKTLPWYIVMGCMACFLIIAMPIFKYPRLSLATCNYGCYPVSVIGSFGGSLLIYYVSSWLSRLSAGKFLAYIGQLTLPILCFHLFQLNTSCCKPEGIHYITLSCAVAFPLLCAWGCTKVGFFRRVFGIS